MFLIREKMRLTNELRTELGAIQTEVDRINYECFMPMVLEYKTCRKISASSKENIHQLNEKLNAYKVRLENIFCETDIKEQAHKKLFFF